MNPSLMVAPRFADPRDALLRDRIQRAIQALDDELTRSGTQGYRDLHGPAVRQELVRQGGWIRSAWDKYSKFFADGSDIKPQQIQPELVEVRQPWQGDLFRLARLTWSLPYNKGYGRRLRFLILDASNEKLIGVLGLQSPPLDFPARDRLFDYPKSEKTALLNQTMDIYTLGAVPPYARLLGGKLIAYAAVSDEVRQAYRRRYAGRETELEARRVPARLVALTTTSAFGRSSLYNRLTFNERMVACSLGYTEGYGSFHLASFYPEIRDMLERNGVSTKGGFGVGPRIVWQTYIRGLQMLGLPNNLLKHGVQREAFLFPLISNLTSYMSGQSARPKYYCQSFSTLAEWWRIRWLLPRSERVDGWHAWSRSELRSVLLSIAEGG